jgi:hypothetical protein
MACCGHGSRQGVPIPFLTSRARSLSCAVTPIVVGDSAGPPPGADALVQGQVPFQGSGEAESFLGGQARWSPHPWGSGEMKHMPQGSGETELAPLGSGETEPMPQGSGETEFVPLGSGESEPKP